MNTAQMEMVNMEQLVPDNHTYSRLKKHLDLSVLLPRHLTVAIQISHLWMFKKGFNLLGVML